ncbi:hypothetical protein I4U23_011274 [Adineta vaga]|nr:hypothetical protein I4U23_011274 [Adineta vaga]
MSETDQITTSLRTFLAHSQKQQKNEKISEDVRRALQVFIEDIQCLIFQYMHDSQRNHEWIRLFCRRVQRIDLKYNSVYESEWKKRREIISYLLSTNIEEMIQSNDPAWVRFHTIMDFEKTLEERITRLVEKPLGRFNCNKELMENYFFKCIALHSNIKTHNLSISTRDILTRLSLPPIEQSDLTAEQIHFLDEKLGSLSISLNCSRQSLQIMSDENRKKTDFTSRNFIPSINVEKHSFNGTHSLHHILRSNRWIMLLGAPGSGKTSLLRWLIVQNARSLVEGHQSICVNDKKIDSVRVPILIRISEFIKWLTKYPDAKLFDYIGFQTWLGEQYMSDEHEATLKCAVCQGRALILLDGLDEMTTFEQEICVQRLVIEFISEYLRSPHQVSAFDDTELVHLEDKYVDKIAEGNQIIITSRFMEYSLYQWKSGAIKPYFLSPLTKEESTHFVNHWINQLSRKIICRATTHSLTFKTSEHIEKTLSSYVLTILIKLFDENDEISTNQSFDEYFWQKRYRTEHTFSVPATLSLLCSAILNENTLSSQKAILYCNCVHSTIPLWASSWRTSATLSERTFIQILSQLAYYLHRKSLSGLIDTFDLRRLCNVSLQTIHSHSSSVVSDRLVLSSQLEALIETLNSNVDIVVVSNLGTYGFVHRTFQEYFVALALITPINESNGHDNVSISLSTIRIGTRLIEHTLAPRFREPLIFALSLASYQMSADEFDSLCCELTELKKTSIPLGALLLLESAHDLVNLPSKTTLFRAFYTAVSLDYSKVFDSTLSRTLENVILAKNWLADYLACEMHIESFCKLVIRLTELPNKGLDDLAQDIVWGDEVKLNLPKWMGLFFTQQLHELIQRYPNAEYILDQTLRRIHMIQDGSISISKHSFQEYLLEKKLPIWHLHSTVVALIIAIYGGLFRYRGDDELLLKFNPHCMYRDSIVSSLLIEYINQSHSGGYMSNTQQLIDTCEQHLKRTSPLDVTIDSIDLIMALICLRGLKKPSEFFAYSTYAAFPIAIERFKRVLFYLRQMFVCIQGQATLLSTWIHSVMTDFVSVSVRNENDICEFIESVGISFVRLTKATNPVLLRQNSWRKVKPACIRLSTKLGTIETNDFLSRAPGVLRLCIIQHYFSLTSLFKKTLTTILKKTSNSVLLAFIPRSMQFLYERLIANNLIKNHNINEDDHKIPFVFFLYQILCYIETKISHHLHPFILSLLEPILIENGFRSYMVVLLARLRTEMSFDFKNYPQYIDLSTSNAIQTAVNQERTRTEHIIGKNKEKCHDEQLFISAICLIRLCRNYQPDEICRIIVAIKNINFRALTVASLWRLRSQEQMKNDFRQILLRNISVCFEVQSINKSPLISCLLLVHSFTMRDAFRKSFQCRYNALLQCFNDGSLCTEDIQAVYRALSDNFGDAFVPSKAVIDYASRTSTSIGKCFDDDTIWSSRKHSGHTFLFASLYLAEIAVDAQVFQYYYSTENTKIDLFSSKYLSDNITTHVETLELLKSYKQMEVKLTAISEADWKKVSIQLCNEQYTITETEQLFGLLKDSPHLFLFIQRQCLSLAEKGVFSSFIVQMICTSLESSDDKLRQQSREFFQYPVFIPFHIDILHILMNNTSSYIEKSLFNCSSMLYNIIKISQLEDLEILLRIEYDRFHTRNSISDNLKQLSFLKFIGQCERDTLNHFIEHIHSLILLFNDSKNTTAFDIEYIINLISHGVHFLVQRRSNILESITLFSEDSTYQLFLINLLKTCQIVPIQEIAAQVLAEVIRPVSVMPNKEFRKQMIIVHELFWEIVSQTATKQKQCEYSTKVLVISLCSLTYRYIQQPEPLFSPDKTIETTLIELHKNHQSCLVQTYAQSLLALYYLSNYAQEGLLQRFDMNVEVVYHLLMRSLQDENGHSFHRPNTERKIRSLISDYPDRLLSLFVEDFKCYITVDKDSILHQNYPAYILIAVELIDSDLLKRYHQVVRMSSLGELGFLQALRSASKKWTLSCQQDVLTIVMAFGNLTWYTVDFILEVALRLESVSTEQKFVKFINEVSEREIIDYVIAHLRASSMIQRYLMGEILIQLVLNDIISSMEIVNELIDTINDPTSQCILQRYSLGSNLTLSEEMLRLCKRLICIVPPMTSTSEFSHVINQEIIDRDFSIALNAPNEAFCLLSDKTDEI